MSYEVKFDPAASDFLSKLDAEPRRRLYEKIMDASLNPRHFFERLSGRRDYKLRIGDYRVIADIDRIVGLIEITYIEHRKKVYKTK